MPHAAIIRLPSADDARALGIDYSTGQVEVGVVPNAWGTEVMIRPDRRASWRPVELAGGTVEFRPHNPEPEIPAYRKELDL